MITVRQHVKACFLLIWLISLLAACESGEPTGLLREDVLFHDEFVAGQMAAWQIEGDALGQSSIVNEQLLIDLQASNVMQFTTLPDMVFQDFILEVEARQLSGDLANSYGVLFRVQDPSRFYRFDITGNGLYMLERRNADGSWTRFVKDWTPAPAIQQGHHVVNDIRIEAMGPTVSVYVNNSLLQQITDNGYAAGQIALDAGTFGDPNMQAAFDNIVVRQP